MTSITKIKQEIKENRNTKFSVEEMEFVLSILDENDSNHPLYQTWRGMLRRCRNIDDKRYSDYGGRGITVCDEWGSSFRSFREWAEDGYKPGLSIERIDNDLGYSPNNCKWVTQSEQLRNTRRNRRLTAHIVGQNKPFGGEKQHENHTYCV